MLYAVRFAAHWLVANTLLLLMAGWLHYNGFFSDSTIQLWSKAILQMDGPIGYRSTASLYPPLPLFFSLILHGMIGTSSIPIPTLFASICGGLIAALGYQKLRRDAGFGRFTSAGLVALTVLNPLFLFVVSDAPELASLCLGAWILMTGLYQLHRRGNAPDMMKVGLGLMIIGLSSPFGLLFCIAAIPFMALVMPPPMLMSSPLGAILAVSFPVICAVGSLLIMSSIFDTPLVAKQISIGSQTGIAAVLLFTLIGSSAALLAFVVSWGTRTDTVAFLAAFGTFAGGTLLNQQIGSEPDILKTTVPLLFLALIAVSHWPLSWFRPLGALAIFIFAWFANGALIVKSNQLNHSEWLNALKGDTLQEPDAVHLAAFLEGKDGVMVDADKNPDLVVVLDGIDNLSVSGSPEFEAVVFGGQPIHPFIVIKSSQDSSPVADRLRRRFPQDSNLTPFGYSLVFERGDWKVFRLGNIKD